MWREFEQKHTHESCSERERKEREKRGRERKKRERAMNECVVKKKRKKKKMKKLGSLLSALLFFSLKTLSLLESEIKEKEQVRFRSRKIVPF